MVLENIINTKQYFQHKEILQISVKKLKIQNIIFNSRKLLLNASTKFKIQNIIFNPGKLLQISVTKFKTIDVILMCLEILLHKHKAVIKVPGIAKQTVNRK